MRLNDGQTAPYRQRKRKCSDRPQSHYNEINEKVTNMNMKIRLEILKGKEMLSGKTVKSIQQFAMIKFAQKYWLTNTK